VSKKLDSEFLGNRVLYDAENKQLILENQSKEISIGLKDSQIELLKLFLLKIDEYDEAHDGNLPFIDCCGNCKYHSGRNNFGTCSQRDCKTHYSQVCGLYERNPFVIRGVEFKIRDMGKE
jgi:hypothetical protein